MPSKPKSEIKSEITKYLTIISRKRYLFFCIFVLATLLSVIYSYTAKKVYKSTATILYEKETLINPLIRGLAVSSDAYERLNTIRELVLSRSRLLEVIRKLDLDLEIKTPLELENLINSMRKAIRIEVIGKNLYSISYEGDTPEMVKNVVNTLCNIFIEENLAASRVAAHDAFSFIEDQLETYRKKLEESENALREFKEQNLGQLPGVENINFVNLEKYQRLLAETEIQLKEANLERSLLEEQLSKEKPLILAFSSSNRNDLEGRLAQLNTQLSSLLTNYTENYPDVIRIKKEIEEIKEKILKNKNNKAEDEKSKESELTTETLNPIYQKIKEDLNRINIEINILNSRIYEYKEKIDSYKNKVESIPKQEQELARLKRGYSVNVEIYQILLNKLEEARISRELEIKQSGGIHNFQVIDTAQLPLLPSKPNKPKLILFGMIIGLGIGSFINIYEVKKYFEYPFLVGIPKIVTNKDIKKKRRDNIMFFSIVAIFISSMLVLILKNSNLFLLIKNSHLALSIKELITKSIVF
jgi:polysaccharide chain length determinant protein (PEP-CTERM system associated)